MMTGLDQWSDGSKVKASMEGSSAEFHYQKLVTMYLFRITVICDGKSIPIYDSLDMYNRAFHPISVIRPSGSSHAQ